MQLFLMVDIDSCKKQLSISIKKNKEKLYEK